VEAGVEKENVEGENAEVWMTPREVAKELGVSVRAIYDLIHSGQLRAKEKRSLAGKRRFWLVPSSEVERLRKLKEW
jgi:excisionase family DNA binding protein